jgi:hypothetical protein
LLIESSYSHFRENLVPYGRPGMSPKKDAPDVKVGDTVITKDNVEHKVTGVRDFGNRVGISLDDAPEEFHSATDQLNVK